MYINDRKYGRGNQKWTIQRNRQQRVQNTKKTATQYVLDTTICKQTQITYIRHGPTYKQLRGKDEPNTIFMWKS